MVYIYSSVIQKITCPLNKRHRFLLSRPFYLLNLINSDYLYYNFFLFQNIETISHFSDSSPTSKKKYNFQKIYRNNIHNSSYNTYQIKIRKLISTFNLSLIFIYLSIGFFLTLKFNFIFDCFEFTALIKELIYILKNFWGGLITGCLHTLAGPDHLAALTPLAIGQSRIKASVLGALWGFGHGIGQLILTSVFFVFRDKLDYLIPIFSKYGGVLVGLILIIIGFIGLSENLENNEKKGSLEVPHSSKTRNYSTYLFKSLNYNQKFTTFLTGIFYGLNPDSLFILLPALSLKSKIAGIAYITMFIFGTILAMSAFTLAISIATEVLRKKIPVYIKKLSIFASSIAFIFGIYLLTQELNFKLISSFFYT